jgi:hypothetical protein
MASHPYPPEWKRNLETQRGVSNHIRSLPTNTADTIIPAAGFETRTLPDITEDTHIVALLGIPDLGDAAAPSNDGWFVSDFYLMNALFEGIGKSQMWLTACEPSELVDKYGPYLHGNPYANQKIVLDSTQLPHDVCTVSNVDLLPKFLETLRSTCQIAKSSNEKVLVLCFGHGDKDTYGITTGTDVDESSNDKL